MDELRKLFLKYLTEDSETQDARRKDFNEAIFDKDDGFQIYTFVELSDVMDKFDKAVKENTTVMK